MSNDKEFVQGISFKPPRDGAPDFVKQSGWIRIDEAIAWLQSKKAAGEESVNFQIKESQGGKLYGEVDNWKPNGNGTPRNNAPRPQRREPEPAYAADPNDDIPFATNRSAW